MDGVSSMFRSLVLFWKNRHFVPAAIAGEFRSRVTRSKIGALWFVLHPLAMALIYVLVLSEVLGAKIGGVDHVGSYAVYLLAGILAWALFSEVLTRCLTLFIDYSSAIKKINFPKVYLPIVVLGSALINNFLLAIAIGCIIAFYGFLPSQVWFGILAGMAVILLLGFGIGILLGVLNTFSRDVGQVMLIVTNLWFWLTPIVYVRGALNPTTDALLELNPMTPVVAIYQQVIVFGASPDFGALIYPAVVGAVLFVVSLFIFWRARGELVDAL